MKWFAILPVELKNGTHAWLRWVWRERVDLSVPYTPIFVSEYMEIDDHIMEEIYKAAHERFPIKLSMAEAHQSRQSCSQYGFIEGARAALRLRKT